MAGDAQERPSNLWAAMVEAYFDRRLRRNRRATNREIALEILLVAALQTAGGQVEITREAMFAADESGLEPTHQVHPDRRVHVLGLRPLTPATSDDDEEATTAATDGGRPAVVG